jgi:hypothetical protein
LPGTGKKRHEETKAQKARMRKGKAPVINEHSSALQKTACG